MIELRVVLAMVVRQFFSKPDRLHPSTRLRVYRGERILD